MHVKGSAECLVHNKLLPSGRCCDTAIISFFSLLSDGIKGKNIVCLINGKGLLPWKIQVAKTCYKPQMTNVNKVLRG